MDRKTSPESFTTFLDILRNRRAPEQGLREATLGILSALSERGPQEEEELWRASGLELRAFADSLQALEEAGLVVTRDDSEVVELTPSGEKLATTAP